jgi:hypothetical protein
MGRASDAHVFKKLAKKYFKFDISKSSFNTASTYYGSLLNSWTKKGMDSADAQLIQEKIDVAMENDEKEYREVKIMTKELPYQLNQMLPKMKTKYHVKGRNQVFGPSYNNTTESSLKYYYKSTGIKY